MKKKDFQEKLNKIINRNYLIKEIIENDFARFKNRIIKPKKGKGHKERPRNSNRSKREFGE